jgi:DNA polymerase-1
LLCQPVPFVGHHLRWELFCLWTLCLPTPRTLWDTCTAERAFQLGLHHVRYRTTPRDEAERARLREEVEETIDSLCSLPATCGRRGVPYGFASARDRLRRSIATNPYDQPFTAEQREYVVAGARAAARLYPIQVQQAILRNALDHLRVVEMPWVVTNAGMIWDGVRIDPDLCNAVTAACVRHEADLTERLKKFPIGNVNSGPALEKFFRSIGLIDAFRKGD